MSYSQDIVAYEQIWQQKHEQVVLKYFLLDANFVKKKE